MGKRSRGSPIGRMGRARKKNHAKYKASRFRKAGVRVLRMPGKSGFTSLQAAAVYKSREQMLVVTITSSRHALNRGPGIFFKKVFEWHRHQNGGRGLQDLLKAELEEVAQQVMGKKLPESGVFLDQCSSADDVTEFLEKTCATCTCWYCGLSPT